MPLSEVPAFFHTGAEFTRPADTTAYAAGDVVGNSTSALTLTELTFASLAAGRGGLVVNAYLAKDGTTVTNAQFRVHLYSYASATVPGQDNAGHGVKYANAPYAIGYIDFPAMSVGTGTNTGACAILQNLNLAYHCEATSLFYTVEALAAYTPASGEKFRLDLELLRD